MIRGSSDGAQVLMTLDCGRLLRVALLLVVLGLLTAFALERLEQSGRVLLPIRSAVVSGAFVQMSKGDLEAAVSTELEAGFLALDLAAIRTAAMRLPWVKQVSVRRVWPDQVRIAVIERKAVARWGEQGFVDADGVPFYPSRAKGLEALPLLQGQKNGAAVALARFLELQPVLAAADLGVQRLELSSRHRLEMVMGGGMVVVMRRGQSADVLARFTSHLPALQKAYGRLPQRVDLRYDNGFAIRFQASPPEIPKGKSG